MAEYLLCQQVSIKSPHIFEKNQAMQAPQNQNSICHNRM